MNLFKPPWVGSPNVIRHACSIRNMLSSDVTLCANYPLAVATITFTVHHEWTFLVTLKGNIGVR